MDNFSFHKLKVLAAYVFFVVTSTGLCLVSSIGHVFGFEAFKPIAKRSVFLAIATIVAGFLVIFFEIENPWRMAIYNVISPNLSSNIWWMGTLYGADLMVHPNYQHHGLARTLTDKARELVEGENLWVSYFPKPIA